MAAGGGVTQHDGSRERSTVIRLALAIYTVAVVVALHKYVGVAIKAQGREPTSRSAFYLFL